MGGEAIALFRCSDAPSEVWGADCAGTDGLALGLNVWERAVVCG